MASKKLYPVIMYYHRPERGFGPLERMIRWWLNFYDTELKLAIRTVESDPNLPLLEELYEELEIERIGWLIGPPLRDTGNMILECYDEWKDLSRDLVYCTDDPTRVALFVLTFESQEPRDNGRISDEEE